MLPVIFKIGSFQLRSYGLLLMLGFLIGALWAQKRAKARGIDPALVFDAVFWMLIPGVLGARIFYIAQEWSYYSTHKSELYSVQFSGLTSFGGFVFAFIALGIWCRIKKVCLWKILNLFSAPMLLANGIGRIGCLLHGCCYGIATDGPLGVAFHDLPGKHLPAQLIETFLSFLGAWILSRLEISKQLTNGRSFGLGLVLLGLARFIYEFWRAGTVDEVARGIASSTRIPGLPITEAQVVSLVFVLLGCVMLFRKPLEKTLASAEQMG